MADKTPGEKKKSRRRSLIEWGAILSVIGLLYITGLHTEVIGTLQRGLLATGLITPDVPELTEAFPEAGDGFYFADRDGTVRSIGQYEGSVLFVNIWATWCPPCIAEMPSIKALYDDLSDHDDITFLLVSMDEEFERAEQFMNRRNMNDLPIYHFRSREPGILESSMIPTTYVITKDGRIAMEKQGLAKYDTPEFKTFLKDLAEL